MLHKQVAVAAVVALLLLIITAAVNARPRPARSSSLKRTSESLPTLYSNKEPRVKLWPQPQSIVQNDKQNITAIIPDWRQFSLKIVQVFTARERTVLLHNYARYQAIIFYNTSVPSVPASSLPVCSQQFVCLTSLEISIASREPELKLDFGMDESSELTITSDAIIRINAQTVWGALRAMETVAQLIQLRSHQKSRFYTVADFSVPLKIVDYPRFPWRGFLIDTTNHYHRPELIKHAIDGMAFAKLNTLHWHIVDTESFPAVIPKYPKLSELGAFRPDAIYTKETIVDIVNYAFERGIRVYLEWDMPGHVKAWGAGYPHLVAHCPEEFDSYGVFNPSVQEVYKVVDDIFAYSDTLQFDSYTHLGGDEINTKCWLHDPTVVAWMKTKNFTTVDEILNEFMSIVYPMLKDRYKKIPMGWDELIIDYDQNVLKIPKDVVIQVWRSRESFAKIVKAGYKSLLSAGWYLDQQRPNGELFYAFEDTWMAMYRNELFTAGNFTADEKKRILGGEIPMWTEQVDDVNFDSRVWPRTLCGAEKLWSAEEVNIIDHITELRLEHTRCNMVRRGIKGGPIIPGYCDAAYEY